jgi:glycosyltransferase involved in cell wall biosynthesis
MDSQMKDIVIVASNPIVRHPRIFKIVSSLKKSHDVTVLGWNRDGVSSKHEKDYIVDLALFKLRAPWSTPTLILYYPLLWTWILLQLIKYKPLVVHAIDLDVLIPCFVYKLIFRKKLVYDVHDRFAGYVPSKQNVLFSMINFGEEILAKRANVLVTVSEKVESTFRLKPKYCVVIRNYSEDIKIDKTNSKVDNLLTLVYTGLILKDQGLEKISEAIMNVEGVELVMAGRIADQELLAYLLKQPNVSYRGLLSRKESLTLEANSDVMMVLYDLGFRKNILSSPNKIFEAMMCGIPLITNMEQDLVTEVDCGLIVDYNNLAQIRDAIILLKENVELRKKMGLNGRRAFVEKYNWSKMEQKLYEIYGNLIKK